ncbi:hypothetical protein ACKWTF_004369 [Chironomus riparius]
MSDLKELQSIKDLFNHFRGLGAQHLLEDENIYARKIDELVKETDEKLELLRILDERIAELEEQTYEKDAIEVLDVEMIRIKTQSKKTGKQIKKLESLNTSRINLDVTERDKIRYRKALTKLALIKRLLEISINKDEKVLMAEGEGKFKVFQLNKNNSKDKNAEIIWSNMKQCSPYSDQWEALFSNKKT